jgi:hypothetical protein
LVVDEILKVFYAPHKVFKTIAQKPKYLGPLLILIIFIAVQTSFYYVRASKIYSEVTLPTGLQADEWTENATLWQASTGVVINSNYLDFINGTSIGAGSPDYYGNSSIEFALGKNQRIQIALADLNGSVDCSETGFKTLSFRIKMVTPDVVPQNATLFLYSLSDSNWFSYDLTGSLSDSASSVWKNITIPVGTTDWSSSNSAARWQNITSLMLEFNWSNSSDIRIRIDGLYFRGLFKNAIEVYGEQMILLNYALVAATPFLVQWLLLAAMMYLIIKGLKGKVTWTPLMVAVGFAMVTLIVQAVASLAAYSTLSPINVPLEYFAGVPGEFDVANQVVLQALEQVTSIGGIVQIAVWLWTIGLGTFIVRAVPSPAPVVPGEATETSGQLSWLKCLLVSAASFVLTITIIGFLGI